MDKTFNAKYNDLAECSRIKCISQCIHNNKTNNDITFYSDKDIPASYDFIKELSYHKEFLCKNRTDIFIAIITKCAELEERMAIRRIYNAVEDVIQFHFFIGITIPDCHSQFLIEKKIYNDISQIPIQESYINQTIFTLYLHKILPIICPYAHYYGKMDADQYINFTKILSLLNINKDNNDLFYTCFTWKMHFLNTNPNYKYSSHKNIKKYYDKNLPKSGLIGFTGSFGLWRSSLSTIIYNESLKESHIIRMEDQHISWLIYKLKRNNITNITFYNMKCASFSNICNKKLTNIYGIHNIRGKYLYSIINIIKSIN